ncbi:hypothetical protein GQR58_019968 [Nymphon striatum]|nr:hypothetical protein GQR58_019968 [Nymphon striatum]
MAATQNLHLLLSLDIMQLLTLFWYLNVCFWGQGIRWYHFPLDIIRGFRHIASLPQYYTNVPPVTSSIKQSPIPAARVASLTRGDFKQQTDEEYQWLDNAKRVLEDDNCIVDNENTSWAAFHASRQPPDARAICTTSLLPLFLESAHTVAMVRHSMDVVKNAVEHPNPGQTPVVTFDQPLFALAKQIQWKWPASYGEDQLVVVFGGLHIEMAALRTLGDWMQWSGWVQALVQAEIATAGSADSFIRASHVLRTRRAHQVTAAALYILQHRAYSHYCLGQTRDAEDLSEFESWCCQRGKDIPQFHYWATMLELELLLLVYVRSLRQGSLMMYIEALTELVPWFYALDHTHYARWIPVHLKDMAELTTKHPDVAKKFKESHFTVQKTQRAFSSIPIDQAHEQNNACIKGDGGAVGLTDNPSALRRWMVAGPEVARVIEEFQDVSQHCRQKKADTRHHDQTPSVQTSFVKDVRSLVDVIEEMGNPFEEESQDVVKLSSAPRDIPDNAMSIIERRLHMIMSQQYTYVFSNAGLINTKLFMYAYLQYRYISNLKLYTIVECQYTLNTRPCNILSTVVTRIALSLEANKGMDCGLLIRLFCKKFDGLVMLLQEMRACHLMNAVKYLKRRMGRMQSFSGSEDRFIFVYSKYMKSNSRIMKNIVVLQFVDVTIHLLRHGEWK